MFALLNRITVHITIMIGLILFLTVYWDDQYWLGRLSVLFAISALFYSLVYEKYKEIKVERQTQKSLTHYKSSILFKMQGCMGSIYQVVSDCIFYKVTIANMNTIEIRGQTIPEFRKQHFSNYRIFYEEIKYFSLHESVDLGIRIKFDSMNLDAEKIINHFSVGDNELSLSETIINNFVTKSLWIIDWSISDEQSDFIFNNASGLLDWISFFPAMNISLTQENLEYLERVRIKISNHKSQSIF